ncbi:MAG TPA: biopolymer transporter ExbD [Candidatus Elarobacter sp.]|jgi:biopolymer transport protein ExbD|nr:biopolymer transporter ExbD [Candidatus Elarobacter sp.]
MSMVSAQQDDAVMAEINITPFTDVLLVLLIIFMILAALVAPPGFEKQLPDKNDNTPIQQQKKTDNIEVLVNETGTIYVDGKRSDTTHIYADMQDVARRKPGKHVSLTADVKAPYGTIIRILDAAKIAHLEDVGFVTS